MLARRVMDAALLRPACLGLRTLLARMVLPSRVSLRLLHATVQLTSVAFVGCLSTGPARPATTDAATREQLPQNTASSPEPQVRQAISAFDMAADDRICVVTV